MNEKSAKPLICPNCFGTDYREVLATAITRDDNEDASPSPARHGGEGSRKGDIRLFCIHCGNELTRNGGGRA